MPEKDLVEEKIKDLFEENFELLRLESGHSITDSVKTEALNQILFYWRKLKDVAEKVTDTEVKLTLPNLKTPKGRNFTIEGIVDIVREDEEVWMYDIKTHDPDYIVSNLDFYEKQLNIYSYIWEHLRGNELNHTAIISTAYPQTLKQAMLQNDQNKILNEVDKWDPVIEIPHDLKNVDETIDDFGKIVDKIEDGEFNPPDIRFLKTPVTGTKSLFATRVCRNCDARYSCGSFREYAMESKSKSNYKKYFKEYINESEQIEWLERNLNEERINQNSEE